eukprot:1393995-Amorphochlora_amoeboformis.AAC.1
MDTCRLSGDTCLPKAAECRQLSPALFFFLASAVMAGSNGEMKAEVGLRMKGLGYIDEFLMTRCAGDLLDLKLYPNAKEDRRINLGHGGKHVEAWVQRAIFLVLYACSRGVCEGLLLGKNWGKIEESRRAIKGAIGESEVGGGVTESFSMFSAIRKHLKEDFDPK